MIISEQEKNRIRKLHKEYSIIKETAQPLYEGMDASDIDLETAAETFDDNEEMAENWDDLDDNMKETFRQHKEFKDMEEEAIREKFNSMDKTSICKIARFLFGWIVKLFKAPLSFFDKQQRSNMGGKYYKRFKAWNCR